LLYIGLNEYAIRFWPGCEDLEPILK
jgi:hypothetical protein